MYKNAGVLFALWFLIVVNYLDRVAISFAGPAMMKSLAISPAQFGIILSSFALGYTLAQLPGGLLADRWGAKIFLVIGPLFWALFTGMTGFITTLAAFVIVRFCFGVSEALPATATAKTVGDMFGPQRRTWVYAVTRTGLTIGPAIGGVIIGAVISGYGWRMAFVVLAVPALAAALLNWRLIPQDTPRRREGADGASFKAVLAQPSLWLLCLSQAAFNVGYWGFFGWMPSYLALARHIDLKSVGLLGSIPFVFGLIGTLVIGWITVVMHNQRTRLVAACYALTGASLFIAYQATGLPLAVGGLSAAAFFLMGPAGAQGSILLDLAPTQRRAAYQGVASTAGQIGGVIAPAVIGFLVTATGTFAGGFAFMIVGFCIAAACMLALGRYISHQVDPEPSAPEALAASQ